MADETENQYPNTQSLTEAEKQVPYTQSLTGTILETEARKQFRRAEPKRAKRARRARARMASDAAQGAIPCGMVEVPRGAAGGAVGGVEETHQQVHGERKMVSPVRARRGTGTG
jgi:hypothetical protein